MSKKARCWFVFVLAEVWYCDRVCLAQSGEESGTLLVKLYKDAGTPSNECSLPEFCKVLY